MNVVTPGIAEDNYKTYREKRDQKERNNEINLLFSPNKR